MKIHTEFCNSPEECFCDKCCLKIVNDNLCNYISKSSLPPLPAGWHGPWEAVGMHVMGNKMYRIMCPAMDYEGAEFLAALLNITHPSPTKEGE